MNSALIDCAIQANDINGIMAQVAFVVLMPSNVSRSNITVCSVCKCAFLENVTRIADFNQFPAQTEYRRHIKMFKQNNAPKMSHYDYI